MRQNTNPEWQDVLYAVDSEPYSDGDITVQVDEHELITLEFAECAPRPYIGDDEITVIEIYVEVMS